MFSSTVSHGKSAKFWKTTAAPGWMPARGLPCCSTAPDDAGISPMRIRRSVDFPHPEGPRTATTSFGRISKSMPWRMTRERPPSSWKTFVTPRTAAIGGVEDGTGRALIG